MAETKVEKPVAAPPEPPKQDEIKVALNKITELESKLQTTAGKKGHNPFLWAREHKVAEIKKRLNAGDKSAIADALRLPLEPDTKVEMAEDRTGRKRPSNLPVDPNKPKPTPATL